MKENRCWSLYVRVHGDQHFIKITSGWTESHMKANRSLAPIHRATESCTRHAQASMATFSVPHSWLRGLKCRNHQSGETKSHISHFPPFYLSNNLLNGSHQGRCNRGRSGNRIWYLLDPMIEESNPFTALLATRRTELRLGIGGGTNRQVCGIECHENGNWTTKAWKQPKPPILIIKAGLKILPE